MPKVKVIRRSFDLVMKRKVITVILLSLRAVKWRACAFNCLLVFKRIIIHLVILFWKDRVLSMMPVNVSSVVKVRQTFYLFRVNIRSLAFSAAVE